MYFPKCSLGGVAGRDPFGESGAYQSAERGGDFQEHADADVRVPFFPVRCRCARTKSAITETSELRWHSVFTNVEENSEQRHEILHHRAGDEPRSPELKKR